MIKRLPLAPNAIIWVQLHLLGGVARLVAFNAIYATILIAAAVGFRQLFRDAPLTSYCDTLITILTGVQIMVIVVGASNAVHRAILRDVNTNMMESHRLSPMSSAAVVMGYVLGSTVQMLTMYAIGIVVGAFVIQWATVGMSDWLFGNLYFLVIAPMAWAVAAMLGVGRPKPINPGTIIFVMLILSPGLVIIPGFGILTGAYAGFVGAKWMVGMLTVKAWMAAAFAVVVSLMTVFWIQAAMRKFRRPDLPMFDTLRAIGLLVIWLTANTVGLAALNHPSFRQLAPATPADDPSFMHVVLTVSGAAGLVISLLPIVAVVFARCNGQRNDVYRSFADRAKSTDVPLCCAALIMLFLVPQASGAGLDRIVYACVSIWASLIALEGLVTGVIAKQWRLALPVIIFIIVFWAVPPMADLWYHELTAQSTFRIAPEASMVFGLSPVGTLAKLFFDLEFDARPGLIVQMMTAAFLWAYGYRSLNGHRLPQ